MRFGSIPIAEAEGAILAHAVKQGDLVLKKGAVIGRADIARLAAAGLAEIVAARLEAGDIGEDEAAHALAKAVSGAGVRVEAPFTGRSNLFAEQAGVLLVDAAAIDRINLIDEAITVATLPVLKAVVAGEMIGTVKIIPFSVPEALLMRALPAEPAMRVAPYRAKSVAVISTMLPGLKPSVVDKTLRVLKERLAPAGADIVADRRIEHEAGALASELARPEVKEADLVVVFGASAITDRADVIPAAIERAGGRIEHFGMPVDPGNLLLVGALGGRPVLGAPGCARSPKENGFDWVLARLLADVPVTRADIQRMGVGGLLMEIVSRPQPREADAPAPRPATLAPAPIEVIVLAAGRSTRMGGPNKLLAEHQGRPLVRHAVERAVAADVGPVIVVTGHQGEAVRAALAGLDVDFVENPDYADGLSTSLKTGLAAVASDAGAALIVLGDMPLVDPAVIRRLASIHWKNPAAKAVVPTLLGERGNPVLISRVMFPAVEGLSGDVGARKLIEQAGDDVVETPVDDRGVTQDIDTPEALVALRRG
jgi:molybdenum cofactor cytidylyltransferase